MNRMLSSMLLMVSLAAHGAATSTQASLTLEGARHATAAAINFARANKAPGAAIAVVDAGGQVMLLERLDGTFPAGAEISIGKARTAVMFRRPTRALEEIINKGRNAMIPVAAVTSFTPLQGGIPIVVDGQVIGGIGVSGAASAQQDEEIAIAGAAAFANGAPQLTVHHIAAAEVQKAFAGGDTGDTLVTEDEFRVNASRRDRAGQAEVHARDTDVFYVLQGHATVVTGGEVVEPHETMPGEIRGSALRGGETLRIAAGDVLTIPHGTPHWFKSVEAPFRYYVIKSVTAP
ncbi:MAG: heme-binding protein [Steroidobacteraceae bacterium]